jgi:hypothetical protein
MLRGMDQNGNGVIEPNEVSGRGGSFIRSMAERAGLDPNQPLPIDKLAASAEAGRQERDRGRDDRNRDDRNRDDRNRDERNRDDRNRDDRGGSSSSNGSASPAVPGGVPGFGVAASGSGATAPGFDIPLTAVTGEPIEQRFDDRTVEYVKEYILKERDVNKNNMLERNEWTGRWSTPPEDSDLNKDGILSFEELCIRISSRYNLSSSRGESSSNGGSGSSAPGSPPGAPGGDPNARFRTYAESLIRQYDESRNGMLERDEWKNMRSEHQSADSNKDGVITVDELAASLAAYSSGSSGWGSRGGGDRGAFSSDRGGWGSRGPGRDNKQLAAKKSYRVGSPVDRLPKGLPDYIRRNDADSDGPISMVEYAATWNDQIAAEFLKLDLNGDGMLTPDECLKR